MCPGRPLDRDCLDHGLDERFALSWVEPIEVMAEPRRGARRRLDGDPLQAVGRNVLDPGRSSMTFFFSSSSRLH